MAPLIPDTNGNKLPTHVHISAEQSGLEIDSLVLLEQVLIIDKRKLKGKITNVYNKLYTKFMDALKIATGDEESAYPKVYFKRMKNEQVKRMESQYKDFYILLQYQNQSIEKLQNTMENSNSYKSKIKDWIIGGIVGALFGIIASISLGL